MSDPQSKDRNLLIIYIVSFLDLFSIGLIYPLFSNHLRDLGASHFQVGLITSLYSGVQIISGPLVGSWSDVRGRKLVMFVSSIVCGLCYTLLGHTSSLGFIVVLRFVLGVSKHIQSLSKAVIADILPINERAGAFGKSLAFSSTGFIVGPLLGGHLSERGGFPLVCLLTGVLFAINAVLVLLLTIPSRPNPRQGHTTSITHDLRNLFSDLSDINWGALWHSFLLRFLFGLTSTIYFSQQSMYLQEHFDLSQRHIGYTISFFTSVGTMASFLVHHVDRIFYKDDSSCFQRLTHWFGFQALFVVCLCMGGNLWWYLAFLGPFAVCSSLLRIVSMELMLKQAAYSHRGSLSGASNSVMSLARCVSPAITGLIGDKLGMGAALFFTAVPSAVGCVISGVELRKRRKHRGDKSS